MQGDKNSNNVSGHRLLGAGSAGSGLWCLEGQAELLCSAHRRLEESSEWFPLLLLSLSSNNQLYQSAPSSCSNWLLISLRGCVCLQVIKIRTLPHTDLNKER